MRKDFFYLTLCLLMLLWGYTGVPNTSPVPNLEMVKYFHHPKLNGYLAKQYYALAEIHLYALDNTASTAALVKAIELDPEPFSESYKKFTATRSQFLSLPANKEAYYRQP